MSYAPGAPELIWAIPDDLLDDGAKLTLMRLWSKADHAVQQAPAPCDVWSAARPDHTPTQALHADLAEARGCSVRKIRRHLTKLRALGLAEANGRLVHLTPPVNGHAVTTDGQSCPSTGDRQRADRDRERAPADRERASGDRKGSAQLTPPVPPTPPSPAVEARATPTPSVKPAESGVLDPRAEVHERIAQQQRELDARRTETRARMQARQRRELDATSEAAAQIEAVRAVSPDWARCLMWPTWEAALVAAVLELRLTPDLVKYLLEAHDTETADLEARGELRSAEADGRPTRRELWSRWSTHRAWVQAQLREREVSTAPAREDWRTRASSVPAWDAP